LGLQLVAWRRCRRRQAGLRRRQACSGLGRRQACSGLGDIGVERTDRGSARLCARARAWHWSADTCRGISADNTDISVAWANEMCCSLTA